MDVKATAKFVRQSPRKVRVVIDLVRDLPVDKALGQLKFINKRAAEPVSKLVRSATANAVNNFDLKEDNLFIKEIRADEGPVLKRWMPRAHGRATPIRKKTTHLSLVLGEVKDSGVRSGRKTKTDDPIKLGAQPKKDEGVEVPKAGEKSKENEEEKGVDSVDPRKTGRRGHAPIEGGSHKGFVGKMFRRKSG